MLTRIITAIVGLIVFIGVILAGETVFTVAIGAVILFMLYEAHSVMTKSKAVKVLGFVCGGAWLCGIYFGMFELSLAVSLVITMIFLVLLHGKVSSKEIFSVVLMNLYVTLFMSYIPKLYAEMGFAVMALVFIISWGSDTAAYFCGTFLGKHKLIPNVSPKKTVEGSLGAVVFAALFCALYVFIMDKCGAPLMGETATAAVYAKYAGIGAVVSVFSQLGDLAASAIKRDANVKDYGSIFPGHGGFLDRFDSTVFIAPAVYYLCKFIIM